MTKEKHVNTHLNHKTESGFSLIELSIMIVLLGIFFAGALGFVEIYRQQKIHSETQDRLQEAYNKIEVYKIRNGLYPCPASLSAMRDSDTYGVPTDCRDFTIPSGRCAEEPNASVAAMPSYCIQENRIDADTVRVRIGAIPFRDLGMSEMDSYDGHGSRLLYAVTEPLAHDETQTQGAIEIIDENDLSLTEGQDANFVILSMGENKMGAFSRSGALSNQCDNSAQNEDSVNCDFLNNVADVSFRVGPMSKGTVQYDDMAAITDTINDAVRGVWRQSTANFDDIVIIGVNLMVGSKSEDPVAALHVHGGYEGGTFVSGDVDADEFCLFDADTQQRGDCFELADLTRTCPAGEYVTGIGKITGSNEIVQCNPLYFGCVNEHVSYPSSRPRISKFMALSGVDVNGYPICEEFFPVNLGGSQLGTDVCIEVEKIQHNVPCEDGAGTYSRLLVRDCNSTSNLDNATPNHPDEKKWVHVEDFIEDPLPCSVPMVPPTWTSNNPTASGTLVSRRTLEIPGQCSTAGAPRRVSGSCQCSGSYEVNSTPSCATNPTQVASQCAVDSYPLVRDPSTGSCTIDMNSPSTVTNGSCSYIEPRWQPSYQSDYSIHVLDGQVAVGIVPYGTIELNSRPVAGAWNPQGWSNSGMFHQNTPSPNTPYPSCDQEYATGGNALHAECGMWRETQVNIGPNYAEYDLYFDMGSNGNPNGACNCVPTNNATPVTCN